MRCQNKNILFTASPNTKIPTNKRSYLSSVSKVSSPSQTSSRNPKKKNYQTNLISSPLRALTSSKKSLEKWKSDPNLLTTPSYIKIQHPSQKQLSSVLKSIDQEESKSIDKVLTKGGCDRTPRQSFTFKKSKKRFQRKNHIEETEEYQDLNLGQIKKRSCSQYPTEERQQFQIQIQSLKKKLLITEQQLKHKDLKIKEIESLLAQQRRQKDEKRVFFTKQIHKMKQQNDRKQKQNQELKIKICESYNQNSVLIKKLQEFMSEPSFLKQHGFSCNIDENSDLDLITTMGQQNFEAELEDQIYQRNLQIYELKKMLEGMKVKQHCIAVKHEQEKRKSQLQNIKRQQYLLKRIKELSKNKGEKKAEHRKMNQLTQSSLELDFSFSFDS